MIVFISFIVVVVAVLLVLLWNKHRSGAVSKNWIEADAIVLNIQLTGTCVKTDIQAIIQLQVQPEKGKSFVGETKEMLTITEYIRVQPGNKIRVKYSSRGRKEILILKESLSMESKLITP